MYQRPKCPCSYFSGRWILILGCFFPVSILNNFYSVYIKNNPNEPKPTLEEFNKHLYGWADIVWPQALAEIHRHTREKYNIRY